MVNSDLVGHRVVLPRLLIKHIVSRIHYWGTLVLGRVVKPTHDFDFLDHRVFRFGWVAQFLAEVVVFESEDGGLLVENHLLSEVDEVFARVDLAVVQDLAWLVGQAGDLEQLVYFVVVLLTPTF